ncbi:hypothetical protein ACHQM5_029674 [Ranunculus cassubicifolius]
MSASPRRRVIPTGVFLADDPETEESLTELMRSAGPGFRETLVNANEQMRRRHNANAPAAATSSPSTAVEDGYAMTMKLEMPGLSQEDVNISVVNNIITIRGRTPRYPGEPMEEKKTIPSDGWSAHSFLYPAEIYKVDEIKAKMVDGVLTTVVPKDLNKREANKDVFNIHID